MRKYFDTILDPRGEPVEKAEIRVMDSMGAAAQLYSDSAGAQIQQPILTTKLGYFEFFVADGTYSLDIRYTGAATRVINSVEIYADDTQLATINRLVSDVDMLKSMYPPLPGATAVIVSSRPTMAALVGMEADSPVYLSEETQEGNFVWRLGDYSTETAADPAERFYVTSDTVLPSAGAWVRSSDGNAYLSLPPGSSLVGFQQSGAGAVSRTSQAKMGETVAVTDYLGVLSTAGAIQAGIDYLASIGGGTLHFPRGTYVLDPTTYVPGYSGEADPQYGPLYAAVAMKSGVRFSGDSATIKLKDNASTDAARLNLCLFHSSESLSNISFDGITFDLNGANNKISPGRAGGTTSDYSRCHHAAIMFTGALGKADDVRIENCTFRDSAGINCIVAGLIVPASGLGKRWRVTNCDFLNNGLDTYDHSSVYLWAQDSVVSGCRFDNDVIYAPSAGVLTGLNAAIELHGRNSVAEGNYIRHANRGVFLATNGTDAADNLAVRNNIFSGCKFSFVDLYYAGTGGDPQPTNWVVENNIAQMSEDDTNVDNGQIVAGVNMVEGGTIKTLMIRGNRLSRPQSTSGRSSAFVVMGLISAGTESVIIENNTATGVTVGAYAYGAVTAISTAKSLVIRGNVWTDLLGGTLPVYPRTGTYFFMNSGTFDRVEISGNSTIDTRGTLGTAASIFVTGSAGSKITELRVNSDNIDTRVPLADRVQVSVVTFDRAYGIDIAKACTPGTIAAGAKYDFDITVPGARPADKVAVSFSVEPTNIGLVGYQARVAVNDTVRVTFTNFSAGSVAIGDSIAYARVLAK